MQRRKRTFVQAGAKHQRRKTQKRRWMAQYTLRAKPMAANRRRQPRPVNIASLVTANRHQRVGDRYKEFSPAHNVSKDDPPAIVFLGSADKLIPVKTAQDFKATMQKSGIQCDVRIFEGKPHGFFNYGRDGNKSYYETVTAMDKFLARLGWISGPPTLQQP